MTALPTASAPPSTVQLPASHLDLLERPVCGVLTTMGPTGRPESSLVWVDHDGECALVNTTLERRKGRNVLANPRASLLVVDPDDTSRFMQIRGEVEVGTRGALRQLDRLTRRYTGRPHYYGGIYPMAQRRRERRVILRLHPRRITLDAIHA